MRFIFVFFLILTVGICYSTGFTLEYFYGPDPGFGNGNIVTVPDTNISSYELDVSLLPLGVQKVFYRAKDKSGNWSHTRSVLIRNTAQPTERSSLVLSHSEDTTLLSSSRIQSISTTTPMEEADIRGQIIDDNGNRSFSFPIHFNALSKEKSEDPVLEYGWGSEYRGAQTVLDTNISSYELDVSLLPLGVQKVFYRAKDKSGNWSHTRSVLIRNTAQPTERSSLVLSHSEDTTLLSSSRIQSISTATPMEEADIRGQVIDDNGNRSFSFPIHFNAFSEVNLEEQVLAYSIDSSTTSRDTLIINEKGTVFSKVFDLSALERGGHSVNVRFKDGQGQWSSAKSSRMIMLMKAERVSQVEYYFRHKPELRSFILNSDIANGEDVDMSIDIEDWEAGKYTLCLRVRNDLGDWSMLNQLMFERESLQPTFMSYVLQPTLIDEVFMIASEQMENQDVSINFFNCVGQLVHSYQAYFNQPVNCSFLMSGMYFVEVSYGTMKRVFKVVKN